MKSDAKHLCGFAILTFAIAVLGNWLTARHGQGVAVAFSGGIFLAVLLLSEQRDWWRWALVTYAVDCAAGAWICHSGVVHTLVDAFGHVAGALAAAWLIRRICYSPFRFETPRSVLALALFSVMPGAALSAGVDMLLEAVEGHAISATAWLIHWTRYAVGGLIAAPLVLTLAQNRPAWNAMSGKRWAEALLLAAFLVVVAEAVFTSRLPLVFLLLPPMLWVGLRFGMLVTALEIAMVAVVALHATALGRGPYAAGAHTPEEGLLMVHVFLILASAAAWMLVAVTSQRRLIQSELLRARDQLESQVVARTAALRENEERFRVARASAKIIIADWDIQRDELTFSDSPEWLRGPLPASGAYPLFKDQVHADDRTHFLDVRKRAVETLEGQTLQFRIVRTDGVTLHIQSFQNMMAGPDGKAARLIAVHQDITERKRTEQILADNQRRLRDSESRYRNLFVNNPLMYFTLDAAGVVISVNPQGANQLGYDVDELVGRPVTAVFPVELQAQVLAQLAECLADTDRVHTWEITKVRKDGASLWVRESAIAVTDGDGAPLLLIMCEDVTARRQVELALRESEQRLRTLLDAIPDQVYLKDVQGRFVMINRAVQEHLGVPEARILGKTIFELRPLEIATQLDAEDKQALASTGPVRVERRSYIGDNWREIILAPIRNGAGAVTGLVAISRDITERKQAELEVLREREQRYRTLVEQAVDIIYQTDAEGYFTYFNTSAALRMLGYDRQDLLGRHYLAFVHPDSREALQDFFRKTLREGQTSGYIELSALTKDGPAIWVGQHVNVVREKGRVIYYQGVCRDISERVGAQAALRDSNDKLRRLSARQEALLEAERTRIAQNLHDGVGQSLSLARLKIESSASVAGGALAPTLHEVVRIIEQSAVAIRTLEFELSPPVLRELGFTPALEWLAEDMRREYGLQVDLSDDGEHKPLGEVSRSVAFRAVRELLLNVSRHAGVSRAHVDNQRAGGLMIITVSDQGAGFDDKAAATGLGLVSVRERIGYLGGSVVIQSTPGEGTVATLSIPLPATDEMAHAD